MAILFVASEAFELKPLAERLTGLRSLKWPLDYAEEGVWQGKRYLLPPTAPARIWLRTALRWRSGHVDGGTVRFEA